MLTRSPGAQSAEHEALPTREPSCSGLRAHSGPAPRSAVLPWAPRPHPAPIRPHRIYRPVPSRTHKAKHPSAPTPGRQWGWESPRSGREGLGGLSCVPRARTSCSGHDSARHPCPSRGPPRGVRGLPLLFPPAPRTRKPSVPVTRPGPPSRTRRSRDVMAGPA